MTLTPDLQKKAAVIVAFVLLMGGIAYYELRDDSPAPAAPVVVTVPVQSGPVGRSSAGAQGSVVGVAAKSVGTTSAQLDPTLRMAAMLVTESLVYSGSGRNIFSATSVPVDMPKPIVPVRPKGPVVPEYTPPPGPPPPPPIDLKFFGTATSADGHLRAFLLKGEDVFLASQGDIVQRRYRVETVSANSIVVEDLANNNKQTLPLLGR
jgi:hypothetical protein